jgi:hypothetical protein
MRDATNRDFGSSAECWTNNEMIEPETLGPPFNLAPEATVEYIEDWYLFRDVPLPASDADADANVLPKVRSI